MICIIITVLFHVSEIVLRIINGIDVSDIYGIIGTGIAMLINVLAILFIVIKNKKAFSILELVYGILSLVGGLIVITIYGFEWIDLITIIGSLWLIFMYVMCKKDTMVSAYFEKSKKESDPQQTT